MNTMAVKKETESSMSADGIGKENEIYTHRFSAEEEIARARTWEVLVQDFFQDYVSSQDTVVDIGAGDGLFIKNINAARKIAIDLSPHALKLREHGVEVYQASASEFTAVFPEQANVVFMSNFLEHLPSKRDVIQVLEECHRALAPGGAVLILQPNIRYVGPAYWDYIDHHIALTEHSVREALEIVGFRVEKCVPRFLPYTAKSLLGRIAGAAGTSMLIRLYLRFPLLWSVFGQQTFVVARRSR